jgi:hypothetical protein
LLRRSNLFPFTPEVFELTLNKEGDSSEASKLFSVCESLEEGTVVVPTTNSGGDF